MPAMRDTKILVRAAALCLLFISTAASGLAVEFYLKLGGGVGFVRPKNIDALINDWQTWQKKDAERAVKFTFLGGEASMFRMTSDFDAEFMASLTSRLNIGLAFGLFYGEIPQTKTELTIEKDVGTFIQVHPVELTALPVALVGYYIQPLGKKWALFIKGGGGMIYAKFVDRDGRRLTTNESFTYQASQSASGQSPYYLGGLGMRMQLTDDLSLDLEIEGRNAKIQKFSGEDNSGVSGTLYMYEEYDSRLDFWQKKIQIHPVIPAGESFRSVGEAMIDMTGFKAKISLFIRF